MSHEVGGGHARGHSPGTVRHCTEELWLVFSGSGKVEDGCDVSTAVAVVGGRPDGDQFVVKHEFDALLNQLVRPTDEGQVVQVHKLKQNTHRREKQRWERNCWMQQTISLYQKIPTSTK